MTKKKILIVTGDPNSINSEIIFKVWKRLNNDVKNRIYFISNYKLFNSQFNKLKYYIKTEKVKNLETKNNINNIKIIDVNLKFKNPFKVNFKSSSNFVLNSLNLAHYLSLKKNVKGLINCSIDKKLLKKRNIGVTEFLASKCKIKDNSEVMLIRNKSLSVSPITTHIDIKEIQKKLKSSLIVKKIKIIDLWYSKKFSKKPKIAILGLNPHNAELRKNSEEKKIIYPAILKLKKLRIKVDGPFVSDTLFISNYKNYDVIIGMYHDQVLAPFKTLFKFDAINVTLGLRYLRVSPDHGTATNLIGKNLANEDSLYNCIKFIDKFGE